MIIKNDGNDTLVVEGTKIKGFLCALVMEHDTAATALDGDDFDLSGIRFVGTLYRGGKPKVILTGNLLEFTRDAGMLNEGYVAAREGLMQETVTAATGVKNKEVVHCYVKLPGTLDVRFNGDKFELEVDEKGCFHADADGTSYLEIVEDEDNEGNEFGLPELKVFNIPASVSSYKKPLGDGLVRCTHVHTSDHTILANSRIIEKLNLSANDYQKSRSAELMLTERLFYVGSDFAEYDNDFVLYKGNPLKNPVLDLTLNSSVVSANENKVVCSYVHVTSQSWRRGLKNQRIDMLKASGATPAEIDRAKREL